MIKILHFLSLVLMLIIISYKPSYASDYGCFLTADPSACMELPVKNQSNKEDIRKSKLENYLKDKNSNLYPYSGYLVDMADYHQLHWTLLPAIAGVESTFCKKFPAYSFNCWGWGNGKYRFQDYYDAIDKISYILKTKYIDRGLSTPESIARVYAPPSKTWARNVRFFMSQIESSPPAYPKLQFTL